MRRHRRLARAVAAALMLGGLSACTPQPIVALPTASQSASVRTIVVGTPGVPDDANANEGALVANLYAAALNAAGLTAVVKPEDPKDPTLLDQLESGTIDVLPGYGATLLQKLEPGADTPDAATVLSSLQGQLPREVTMLDPTKAEDNDSVVVTAVTAQKYQLKTLADLGQVCRKLSMGGSAQFRTADHGIPGLDADYGCVPASYKELPNNNNQLLMALLRNEVQIADIHSSSPDIQDNALVTLTDTKGLFIHNPLVALANSKTVPVDYQAVINKVSAQLNNEELQNLNRLGEGASPSQLQSVAKAWLVQNGLVKQ